MSSKPRFVGEKVRLGDVATYVNGYAFKPSDYSDSGLPIVRIQNLTGNAYRTNRYEGTLPEKFAIQDGDILISWSASLGVFEWNQGPAWLNQHIFRVVFNKAMIDKRFFVHQARFLIQKSQNLAHGATMKHLTKKVFETLPFLYLGLNNQITIAEQLDALDTQINRAKRQIRFLDNLAKSRFVEMFLNSSWPIATIGECSMDIHYGTSEKASTEGEYVYLRMNNMGDDGSLDLSDIKRITLEGKALSNCLVRKGDLLFNRTNSREKVGKTCVFCLDEPMVIAGYIIRVRLDDRVDSTYLAAYMNLSSTKALLRGMAKGAVHQANINAKQLASIEFPLADIKAQKEFVSFVSQVDKSRFIAKQQIEKLQMLYDSLAQDYFGD